MTNLRWVLVCEDRHGTVSMMEPAQGRYTYATAEEAFSRLEAITRGNAQTQLQDVYGPRFLWTRGLRAVECHPGHNDPTRTVFGESCAPKAPSDAGPRKSWGWAELEQGFYLPREKGGRPCVLDAVHPLTGRGVWGKQTLEEAREEYGPEVTVLDLDEAAERIDEAWKSPPIEVTREDYYEALNVLPPEDWYRGGSSESFKMCERTSGSITAIYCRIGGRFWCLSDRYDLPHARIVEACAAMLREVAP